MLPGSLHIPAAAPAGRASISTAACSASPRPCRSLSGVLFGLAPARLGVAGRSGQPAEGTGARCRVGPAAAMLRYGLVASEVALTLVTLAGAGMMIVSVSRLLGVDPGLDPRNVLVMEMSLPQEDLYYGPPDAREVLPRTRHAGAAACRASCRSAPSDICRLAAAGPAAALASKGSRIPGRASGPAPATPSPVPNILRDARHPAARRPRVHRPDGSAHRASALVNERMARRLWPEGTRSASASRLAA